MEEAAALVEEKVDARLALVHTPHTSEHRRRAKSHSHLHESLWHFQLQESSWLLECRTPFRQAAL